MYTELANEFTERLFGMIPDEYLGSVRDQLSAFLSDYDIQKKTTDIQVWSEPVPKEIIKYLASVKISGGSDKTIDGYKIQLINFFKAMGKQTKNITSDDILLYLAKYKQTRNVSDSSLDHYRTILNSYFEWCVNEDIISKNPCKKIKPIKYWKEKEIPLTDYQVESIRAACKTDRDLAIIDFMLSTGCRVSEVASVKISDIDFIENRLQIIGKGNKKRTVYLTGKAVHSMKKYLETRGFESDILFAGTRKPYGRIKKDAIEKMIRQIGESVGIKKLHPHLFRKTMATNALKRGMDVTIIQRILGHENIETTMRYINMSQEDVENAHRRYVA